MSALDWKYHCSVLAVPEHASPKEIKDAYRKLAQRFHPDHNGGTHEAKECFQRINASYLYLSKNLAKRPTFLKAPQDSNNAPPNPEPVQKNFAADSFFKKKEVRAHAFMAAALLMATFALNFFLRDIAKNFDTQETPIISFDTKSNGNVDSFGRQKARCELYSFQQGNLITKQNTEMSEVDCNLSCYAWFAKNEAFDASCLWNGKEFQQHAAKAATRYLAEAQAHPPEAPQENHGLQTENPFPIFIPDSEPENLGNIPIEMKSIRLGEEHVVNNDFVPMVWMGDTKLIHGDAGINARQVIIKPIRKGVTGIVITDAYTKRRRKIIYNIE